MPANLPSVTQWTALCKKHGLNDNGVRTALAAYERFGDNKPAERARALDEVAKLAGALKQSKEAKANADAGRAIDGVAAAAKAASKVQVAAAEKAKAAEKQKPDPAKTKALLTALRKLGKLPDVNAGGSGSAKDPSSYPCSAEKEKADVEFLKLLARPAFQALIGGIFFGPAGAGAGVVSGLYSDVDSGLGAFIDAFNKLLACLNAHRNAQAGAVETRLSQVRQLRAGLQRERERFERWHRMVS